MFAESFDNYVCTGDTISCKSNGFTVTARIEPDCTYHIDDDDCHNEDQNVTGCTDEHHRKNMAARESWFNDEWFYCGVVLSVSKNGIMLDEHAASLWGIECNYPVDNANRYLTEVANELLPEAIEAGREAVSLVAA